MYNSVFSITAFPIKILITKELPQSGDPLLLEIQSSELLPCISSEWWGNNYYRQRLWVCGHLTRDNRTTTTNSQLLSLTLLLSADAVDRSLSV